MTTRKTPPWQLARRTIKMNPSAIRRILKAGTDGGGLPDLGYCSQTRRPARGRHAGLSHATAIDGVAVAGERAQLQFVNAVRRRGNSVWHDSGQFGRASSVLY